MEYNVIATAYRGEARYLLKELSNYGTFCKTSFRDVLVGKVDDIKKMLEELNDKPPLSLARLITLSKVIEFKKPDELLKKLKDEIKEFKPKGSFRVTVERRGWKGEINSYEWAKQLGAIIFEKTKTPVNLEDPQVELVIEVMTDTCGLTSITKADKDKYYFLRAK